MIEKDLKCSECGGKIVKSIKNESKIYVCLRCRREKKIVESEIIDMGTDSNLEALME